MTGLMRPVVRWALGVGLGHGVVSKWLKLIFYDEALRLLKKKGVPPRDSALALMAGLHRGDVRQFQEEQGRNEPHEVVIPITHQVLANWLLAQLPETIPLKSAEASGQRTNPVASFTDLITSTPKVASNGFSPALILQDMLRQGLVSTSGGQVTLLAFGASAQGGRAHATQHISAATSDLISAGLHNLRASDTDQFLEQSLEVDGLHPDSVAKLHLLATAQWAEILQTMLPPAKALSDQDEFHGGQHRVRLGIYFYAEPTAPVPDISVSTPSHSHTKRQA